ncbi:MAG: glycosyltransferase family 87 protein [Bacteroidota bacterium]
MIPLSFNKTLVKIVYLTLFLISLSVYGKVYFVTGSDVPARADFRAFITAADMIKGEDADHLYDLSYQIKWQSIRFGDLFPINKINLLVFVYPPWVATLLIPLGGLTSHIAYLIFMAINIMVLTGCAILIKLLIQEHTDISWIFIWLFIAFPPVMWTLMQGQFSLWLLLGLLGCWYGISKDFQIFAGLALGLLLIKPYLLLFPCIYLFFIKRWRAIFGLSIAVLLSFVLCMPLGGWNIIKEWISLSKIISQSHGQYGVYPESMHTIKGVLYSLKEILMITDLRFWWVVTAGVITIIIIYLLWGASREKKDHLDSTWGLIVLGSLLTAPHANSHDLILLMPCYMILPFMKFKKYNNIIIWIIIFSLAGIWGSVLYESSEAPRNLITVSSMLIMLFLFTKDTK